MGIFFALNLHVLILCVSLHTQKQKDSVAQLNRVSDYGSEG